MTFKLKKTELFKALISALCALAVAFAVVLLLPRGAAAEDEPETEATYTVTWEYKTSDDGDWQSFASGITLFTYEEGVDYSDWVRAKIERGEESDVYNLSYSGTFVGENVTALENATEYKATIVGAPDYVADNDKEITFKIAPKVLNLSESNFEDYHGAGSDEQNRLWLLGDDENATALGDLVAYYDADAEYSSEYGTTVTNGVLYNSYARYNGNAQTVTLNPNYVITTENKPLIDYLYAVDSIAYTHNDGTDDAYRTQPFTGKVNAVNKITTRATITLNGNWVLSGGEKSVTLTKEWYVVTVPNMLRTLDGKQAAAVEGWAFGGEIPALPVRPEHGDNAVFTLAKVTTEDNTENKTVLERFAVKYSDEGIEYYGVKADGDGYVIDTAKALDDDYYEQKFSVLKVGAYALDVFVPAYTSTEDHEHWWNNAEPEAANVVYCSVFRTYSFSVTPYDVTVDNISINTADNKDISIKFKSNSVVYNGLDNNIPEAVVTFRGVELEYDVDYEFISHNVKVGKATFTFVGKGSLDGTVPFDGIYEYDITPAVNSWKDVPSIMYWTYGNYDKQMNLISGTPTYLDNPNDISFKVTTDMAGEIPAADVLATFQLTDGIVSNDVAAALNNLTVGTYYLFATVNKSTNYQSLAQRGVAFKVFPATNSWEVTPAIVVWTEGQFKSVNMPVAKALYGNVTLVIKDGDGKDVYNNVTGVNRLSAAKAGTYTLSATVMGSNDYDGLVYSTVFNVHEKPGIPAWVTVLIVLGALLAVALVIFVLIKTGVLRILTNKLMVKIRTQAAVDATVAAVRANKKNEEAKQLVAEFKQQEQAEAKKEERKKARKARAAEQKALPLEQKIAALEEKARKAEARAEKMKARADAIQQRADRMREATVEPTEPTDTEPAAEAASTDTETTTEE